MLILASNQSTSAPHRQPTVRVVVNGATTCAKVISILGGHDNATKVNIKPPPLLLPQDCAAYGSRLLLYNVHTYVYFLHDTSILADRLINELTQTSARLVTRLSCGVT